MQGKLNQLISSWRRGTVKTSTALKKEGYSDDLLSKYAKSRWIESIGFGAYKLYDDSVEWYGAIYALQKELKSSIHVAGKTALTLKGLAHNVPQSMQQITLFNNDKGKLPKWFLEYNWGIDFNITKTGKLGNYKEFLSQIEFDGIEINVSSPELAIMELLFKTPEKESFNEAELIMEGLMSLRPNKISKVLKECKSVKTKRLFMYLAEKYNHPWFKRLNIDGIYLGKGKRQIVPNGKLDKKYLITVPGE